MLYVEKIERVHGNSCLSAKKWECSVEGAETQSRDREVREKSFLKVNAIYK